VQLESGFLKTGAKREGIAARQQRLERRPHFVQVARRRAADLDRPRQAEMCIGIAVRLHALPPLRKVETVGACACRRGELDRRRTEPEQPVSGKPQQALACAKPFMARLNEQRPDRTVFARGIGKADHRAIALAHPAAAKPFQVIFVHLLRNSAWVGQYVLAHRKADRAHGWNVGSRRAAEFKWCSGSHRYREVHY
jgi:hypothetical protein